MQCVELFPIASSGYLVSRISGEGRKSELLLVIWLIFSFAPTNVTPFFFRWFCYVLLVVPMNRNTAWLGHRRQCCVKQCDIRIFEIYTLFWGFGFLKCVLH